MWISGTISPKTRSKWPKSTCNMTIVGISEVCWTTNLNCRGTDGWFSENEWIFALRFVQFISPGGKWCLRKDVLVLLLLFVCRGPWFLLNGAPGWAAQGEWPWWDSFSCKRKGKTTAGDGNSRPVRGPLAAANLSVWLVSPVSKLELEMAAKSEFGEQKAKLAVDLEGVPWDVCLCVSFRLRWRTLGLPQASLGAQPLSILLSSLCCKFRVEMGIPRLTTDGFPPQSCHSPKPGFSCLRICQTHLVNNSFCCQEHKKGFMNAELCKHGSDSFCLFQDRNAHSARGL